MDALLTLARLAARDDMIGQLHAAIEKEIVATSKRIEVAADTDDKDYADGVIDDECELVEQPSPTWKDGTKKFFDNQDWRVPALMPVALTKSSAA